MKSLKALPVVVRIRSAAASLLAAALTVGLGLLWHQAALSSSNHANPDAPQASSLLADLSSQDPAVVSRAISRLRQVNIPAAEALPHLIVAATNSSEFVRLEAVNAIAGYGVEARDAMPVLVKALNDPDPLVREAAALALLAVGSGVKSHAQRLIPLLRDDHKTVRDAAIAALAGFGPDSIPDLVKVLESNTPAAGAASEALARIGAPAVAPLIEALKKGGNVADNAAKALAAIGKPSVAPLIKLLSDPNPAIARKSEEILIAIGPAATEGLIKTLRSRP